MQKDLVKLKFTQLNELAAERALLGAEPERLILEVHALSGRLYLACFEL